MGEMVCSFNELIGGEQHLAGGKGSTLAKLYQKGYKVPDGFIIMPGAFHNGILKEEAWIQTLAYLKSMRKRNKKITFAVRSSSISEDSAEASFAGEYETVLDVSEDTEIKEAILKVANSRESSRVGAYSKAKNIVNSEEIAVVVQQMILSEISGVLFTADPITGRNGDMIGNFIYGLGEKLVSGESNPETFTINRKDGIYDGPTALMKYAHEFQKLGEELEKELEYPQDIEWAIAEGKLFLLQSRPISTLEGYDPVMGQWNDSLKGDFLWSNCNAAEALPDVMTPLTWSIWEIFHEKTYTIKLPNGYSLQGNIAGRSYFNYSVFYSLMRPLMDEKKVLKKTEEVLGILPEGLDIPKIQFSKGDTFKLILSSLKWKRRYKKIAKEITSFIPSNTDECNRMEQKIRILNTPTELYTFWHEDLETKLHKAFWMLRGVMKPVLDMIPTLNINLTELVGTSDASILLSNLGKEDLASLGPLIGISKVASGKMTAVDFLKQYGHRGPHEAELFLPRPKENPKWLEERLKEKHMAAVHVEELLERQRNEFTNAWRRLEERYPAKINIIQRQLNQAASAAQNREAVRSEVIRVTEIVRKFCLRVGDITDIGQDIFFLTIDEICEVLLGKRKSLKYISIRKERYNKYCSLPTYPSFMDDLILLNGRMILIDVVIYMMKAGNL